MEEEEEEEDADSRTPAGCERQRQRKSFAQWQWSFHFTLSPIPDGPREPLRSPADRSISHLLRNETQRRRPPRSSHRSVFTSVVPVNQDEAAVVF